ncbi:MAG: MFS transporter [Rhodospirillaceae bacterium]|nr:MFS transporter [Rhodospirillaceae bacterium]
MSIATSCNKFGPVWLAPGVSKGNTWTLMYAAFFTIGLLTFIGIGTPYILTEILQVPNGEQGTISGNLVFWTEIVSLLLFGPVGIAADRIGRKSVYLFGFLTMGLGYALYPTADTVTELTLYRVIYAIGIATSTGMLATIVTDYPQEASRGKLVGIVGAMNGLGVVFINRVFGSLPERFTSSGMDGVEAGEMVHWLVAGLCIISTLVLWFGLKDGTPAKDEEKPAIKELAISVIKQGIKNPRIALSYGAAFIARGDLVILGTFLTLWGTIAGTSQGLPTSEATRNAALAFVAAQSAALLWTFVIIFFIDRFNRTGFLAFCMALAALGYLGMGLVEDPTASDALPFVILLGIGQISAFFGSQALVGQEAPKAERGAVIGGFNISGAVGILFCSVLGGWLFDNVSPGSVFLMVGSINAFIFLCAVLVRWNSPGRMPGETGASDGPTLAG